MNIALYSLMILFESYVIGTEMSDFGYGNGLGYGEAQGGGFYRFEVCNAFVSHRLAGAHCLPFPLTFASILYWRILSPLAMSSWMMQ